MANDNKIYLIDTDVLVHIHKRPDHVDIYNGLIKLAESGQLKTVKQVFGELKKHEEPFKILSPHKRDLETSIGQQYAEQVGEKINYLVDNANYLWEQVGYKNPDPADPWLIAVASVYSCIVVTDENQNSSVKIPAACKLDEIKCPCITGPHFLLETEIVKEIKPEEVSVTEFFKTHE